MADCVNDTLFVFGGRRANARRIVFAPDHGELLASREAALPFDAGFKGRTFALAIDTAKLPGALREHGPTGRLVTRVPTRWGMCPPLRFPLTRGEQRDSVLRFQEKG